jgi:hypothetical protein
MSQFSGHPFLLVVGARFNARVEQKPNMGGAEVKLIVLQTLDSYARAADGSLLSSNAHDAHLSRSL